jgi:hypothetical protein
LRTFALLLLILWLSRIPSLETLPLHNDEGLHLTRAVEVWNLHPFWEIRDGKIINQWAIALFYPQNAPVFAGRIATIFVSLIGFAAGYALIRRLFGGNAALIAGALWIASPYLFFFERLALSDAEAGALVVLALWVSWLLAERGTVRRAIFTGLALALAALFKFTAAPFALSVALIVLLRAHYSIQRRIGLLAIAAVVVGLCFVVPVGYLMLRGGDLFSIALAWVSGGSAATGTSGIGANLAMLWAQLVGFSLPFWSLIMGIGLVLLLALKPRTGGLLLLAIGLPLASIIVLGHEVLPRHYVVALPASLILGGAGIGVAANRWLKSQTQRRSVLTLTSAVLAFGFIPFALDAYSTPDLMRVPDAVWTQYFSEHSAGYGLREAVLAFPQTITPRDMPIVASMTGDSCRRANFYAMDGLRMLCGDTPNLAQIQTALKDHSEVYVLVDFATGAHFPQDAAAFGAQAEQVALYPRPGFTGQPVTLWKLTKR